jgi:hypothetical protein
VLFKVLGPLEVELGADDVVVPGGARARALFAALLLRPGAVVPVHRLAEVVWGEAQPESVENAVHVTVARLRRALGAAGACVVTRAPGYLLDLRGARVDADLFRVRAAMDTQVVNEGRHQGGRAPYGYVVVDGGPHPNPGKAAEGHRLRVLAVDEATADVVRRIFAEKLEGAGDQAIAAGLNRDGVPCPSMRWPDQNWHRLADGWQGSAVRAVLENPRYTGYAVFGRWKKHEELLDPDDVAAGHVTRFRRAEPGKVVRSRTPAHPAMVSVETFTDAQLVRRARAAGGLAARRKLERGRRSTARPYPLRGRVRCGYCARRMEGSPRGDRLYYRCAARSIVPGAPILATHPKNVYLAESAIVDPINAWIGGLFAPDRREDTVRRLLDADATRADTAQPAAAEKAVADAEQRLRRLHAAIEAGVDPIALVERSTGRRRSWKWHSSSASACLPCRRWGKPSWRQCSTRSVTWGGRCDEPIPRSWRSCTERCDWKWSTTRRSGSPT